MAIRKKKADFAIYKYVNCPALNIRSGATVDSIILKTIQQNTIVKCDNNFIDKEWDHILTDSFSCDGFCMKKFLTPLEQDKEAVKKELENFNTQDFKCDGSITFGREIHNNEEK